MTLMPLTQGQVFEVLGSPFLQPAGYGSSRFLQLILKPFSLTPPRIHSPLRAIVSFLNIACSSHPNSTCHPAYEHTQPHMPNIPMHMSTHTAPHAGHTHAPWRLVFCFPLPEASIVWWTPPSLSSLAFKVCCLGPFWLLSRGWAKCNMPFKVSRCVLSSF